MYIFQIYKFTNLTPKFLKKIIKFTILNKFRAPRLPLPRQSFSRNPCLQILALSSFRPTKRPQKIDYMR